MRIAVTSQNFRTVTGHAGRAHRFIVYETEGTEPAREIERLDLGAEMIMHGFDAAAPHPLDRMDVLITGGAGQGFVQRLAARGVRVAATHETDPARAVESYLRGDAVEPAGCHHGHAAQHGGCGCKH